MTNMLSHAPVKFVFLAIALAASIAPAGPLNPPAGPVAPTQKPLAEIEPRIAINAVNTPSGPGARYRITKPGSYYLTGNLENFNVENAIQVDLDTEGLVTIDLNGFSVIGREGTLNGIDVDGPFQPRVVLKNGHVTMFDGNGVDMTGAENATIENVESTRNSGRGFVIGSGSITSCKAQFNSAGGFKTGAVATLTNCQAATTGPIGFETLADCTLVDCTAKGSGNHGFSCTSNCNLARCSAVGNGGNGMLVVDNCTLIACTASGNTQNGIDANNGCTITQCTAAENTGIGINTNAGAGISGCTVVLNQNIGVDVGQGTTVSGCTVRANYLDGIRVTSLCSVVGNTCSTNGNGPTDGAGIVVSGTDNRIESNHCTGADRGVDVDLSGNIIIKNVCAGNTSNWTVVAGNVCLVVNAATSAAITGNAGGVSPGSTDPNANFTY